MKKLVGEMSDLLNKIVKFSDDYADVKDIFLNDSTMELAEDAIGSLKFLIILGKHYQLLSSNIS